MTQITITKPHYVVKSNKLINACYKLSLLETQLIQFAIFRSREENKGLDSSSPVYLKISQFRELYDPDRKNHSLYSDIKTAINRLWVREFGYLEAMDGSVRRHKVRWLQELSYNDKKGEVSLTFTNHVAEHLYRVSENFTRYEIKDSAQLTSSYAVRFYEFLSQYERIGTRKMSIEQLREMLQLENEYTIFGNLKARVIDTAVAQINKHTNLKVMYQLEKENRKVWAITFKISQKPAKSLKSTAWKGQTYKKAVNRTMRPNPEFGALAKNDYLKTYCAKNNLNFDEQDPDDYALDECFNIYKKAEEIPFVA
jgi:plasmid replication initiation protein